MKGSRWFIVAMGVFVLVMFGVESRMPKKFVWNPTFSHTDEQPFGCALMDSLFATALKHGYTLSDKTFYQLSQEDSTRRRNFLLISMDVYLEQPSIQAVLNMAESGDRIMLVGESYSYELLDTLRTEYANKYTNLRDLPNGIARFPQKDSVFWVGNPHIYPPKAFPIYYQLYSGYFLTYPTETKAAWEEVLACKWITQDEKSVQAPIAVSYRFGKGEIILVSTPLLFTNYGVMDGETPFFLLRLLSRIADRPVVRLDEYNKLLARSEQSPFSYLLSQPPLRWALYVGMAGILLFVVFTAKRRQRVIPVMHEPENKSLEFVKLIGTLYFQKKNPSDLVCKKFTYFAAELRNGFQINVEEGADNETYRRIALNTGMEESAIAAFFKEIRPILEGKQKAGGEQMKQLIDTMNKILNESNNGRED